MVDFSEQYLDRVVGTSVHVVGFELTVETTTVAPDGRGLLGLLKICDELMLLELCNLVDVGDTDEECGEDEPNEDEMILPEVCALVVMEDTDGECVEDKPTRDELTLPDVCTLVIWEEFKTECVEDDPNEDDCVVVV